MVRPKGLEPLTF